MFKSNKNCNEVGLSLFEFLSDQAEKAKRCRFSYNQWQNCFILGK